MPIITLEGCDGSGKKTQTELLVKKLEEKNYPVKTLAFPRYDTKWGKEIKNLLNSNHHLRDINPYYFSLFFILDRYEIKSQLEVWEKDYNVILDRYMEANLAHQGAKLFGKERKEIINFLLDLEYNKLKIPKSDIVVYLDLPVEFSKEAMEKEKRNKDIHEQDANYQKNVREVFISLTERFDNWYLINCLDSNNNRIPKEELTEIIFQKVKPILKR